MNDHLKPIVDAIATAPAYLTDLAPSQAEFVDWARANGADDRVTDFLAARDDFAGATPAAWSRYSHALRNADYRALRCDQQNGIALAILGKEAFTAHQDWMRARQN